jgi:hypothetical protein
MSGKRTSKVEQWQSRMQRFRVSGLSVTRFCEQEQVCMPSFYQWRKRLADGAGNTASPTFLPVRVTQSAAVEIHLPSGARISVPPGEHEALRVAIEAARQSSSVSHGEANVC